MAKQKACMFTGHRPNKLPWGYKVPAAMSDAQREAYESCVNALDAAIELAYNDGCKLFITGMALGIDQIAACRVARFKKDHKDVVLMGYIPCYGQDGKWPASSQELYLKVLSMCDEWLFVHEREYVRPKDLDDRNKWMVADSTHCISVWNGTNGGTANAMRDVLKTKNVLINYDLRSQRLVKVAK